MADLRVGQHAATSVRAGGSLTFVTGNVARRPGVGMAIAGIVSAAPGLTANLALELAPIRVNLLATGFVDTPLSASLLGDELGQRREQLRAKLPIGRVVEPTDLAALAVHLMVNTAVTGSTYDIDGGGLVVGI
ncbi:MAG TPA: SDR family oxidoreductase [Streptosporangiaceae bacterium]|nr:SDR family oxidoreductase [Streptosporangiaceae bacterium]